MKGNQELLEFAKQYIESHTDKALSDLEITILRECLRDRSERKTYDQIAAETEYSSRYVKQVVAPQLWKLLSEVMGRKVTKLSVRLSLEKMYQAGYVESSLSSSSINPLARPQANDAKSSVSLDGETNNVVIPSPIAPMAIASLAAQSASSAPCILVVDDQPHNLTLLTEVLENEKYEVWPATNGADALALTTS